MTSKIKIIRNKPEFSAGNPNASLIPGADRPMVTTGGLFQFIDIFILVFYFLLPLLLLLFLLLVLLLVMLLLLLFSCI